MRKTLCFFLFLLFISGCTKPSGRAPEYLGNWLGLDDCPFTSLFIYEDDTGCFYEDNPSNEGCHYTQCGKINVAPFYLYIGSFRFHILDKPHRVAIPVGNYAGYYEMRLQKPLYLDGHGGKITFRRFFY